MVKCVLCEEPGTLCSACHQVSYCSPSHQKQDWKFHKKVCCPFVIKEEEGKSDLGLQWIAARNLPAGTILLEETPAFHGPHFQDPLDQNPICLTCEIHMDWDSVRSNRCSNCQWPLCSQECQEDPIHSQNECKIFSKLKIPYPPQNGFLASQISACIWMARGIALNNFDTKSIYEDLMKLQYKQSIPKSKDEEERISKRISLFRNWLGFADSKSHTFEDCLRIIQLSHVNGFAVNLLEQNSECTAFRNRNALYVYIKASRINQSCSPNCTWAIGPYPNFHMRIRTVQKVLKGEPLTIYYNIETQLNGTLERQKQIRRGFGFICKCPRCLDPLELDSMMSAIVCSACRQQEKVGYFLPKDPLNISDDASWVCSKCDLVKKSNAILPPIEEISKIFKQKDKNLMDKMNGKFEQFCDQLKEKYSGISLHPNHWILQDAARAVIQYKTNMTKTMTKDDLEKYVELNQYLLNIQNLISPGISFCRGTIQFNMSIALAALIERFGSKMELDEITSRLLQCKRLQVDAWLYHKDDVPLRGGKRSYDAEFLQNEMVYIDEHLNQLKLL